MAAVAAQMELPAPKTGSAFEGSPLPLLPPDPPHWQRIPALVAREECNVSVVPSLPSFLLLRGASASVYTAKAADGALDACARVGEGHLDLHSRAFSKVLQCCLPQGSLPAGSGGAQGRGPLRCDLEACGAKRAPEVRVRLLPCSAHLATMGGSFVEECPMSSESPEVHQRPPPAIYVMEQQAAEPRLFNS